MAKFKVVARTAKEYNNVYIRISHKSKSDYIRTTLIVHKSGINKRKEVTDHFILAQLAVSISSYVIKLNNLNIKNWTVSELKKFLTEDIEGPSFSDFAKKYIEKMQNNNREKSSRNYKVAFNSFKSFFRSEKIYFSDVTANIIRKWINDTLLETARAKQLYPVCIKKMFEEGCLEFNDYDRNIIRISNQPFKAVKIPKSLTPKKRSVEAKTIQKIINVQAIEFREKQAQDILMLIIHLAGINLVDLYFLEKSELKKGKLCYNRHKTENKRPDKAYFEISIPKVILPIFEKYKGKKRLLCFSEQYSDRDNFTRAINIGLRHLCERAQTQKITSYWLRHTWATIAKNKCKYSTEQVSFALNHSSAHRITEDYIEKDFSIVDEMNAAVIKYIFTNLRKKFPTLLTYLPKNQTLHPPFRSFTHTRA